jgi:hypothetical protein
MRRIWSPKLIQRSEKMHRRAVIKIKINGFIHWGIALTSFCKMEYFSFRPIKTCDTAIYSSVEKLHQ